MALFDTRGELRAALDEMVKAAKRIGASSNSMANQDDAQTIDQTMQYILDQFFPKPKSERLEKLEYYQQAVRRNDLVHNLTREYLLHDLIDQAVAEERKKQE